MSVVLLYGRYVLLFCCCSVDKCFSNVALVLILCFYNVVLVLILCSKNFDVDLILCFCTVAARVAVATVRKQYSTLQCSTVQYII